MSCFTTLFKKIAVTPRSVWDRLFCIPRRFTMKPSKLPRRYCIMATFASESALITSWREVPVSVCGSRTEKLALPNADFAAAAKFLAISYSVVPLGTVFTTAPGVAVKSGEFAALPFEPPLVEPLVVVLLFAELVVPEAAFAVTETVDVIGACCVADDDVREEVLEDVGV